MRHRQQAPPAAVKSGAGRAGRPGLPAWVGRGQAATRYLRRGRPGRSSVILGKLRGERATPITKGFPGARVHFSKGGPGRDYAIVAQRERRKTFMVKVCKTAAEFSKLKYEDFDYGPEIYGNIDVTGKILAETLSLDERTIRNTQSGELCTGPPRMLGYIASNRRCTDFCITSNMGRFFGAWELSRTTTMGGTFRGPGPERCRARSRLPVFR